MKGFEEWWHNKEMKNYLWGDYGAHEDTWREALKWVKKHYVELGIDDWTIIEQELKERENE